MNNLGEEEYWGRIKLFIGLGLGLSCHCLNSLFESHILSLAEFRI